MMGLEPGRDGLDRAIGEQLNGQTALQITDQGPIAQSAFPCPVIDSHDSRLRRVRLLVLTDQTQDGITTAAETELASQVCSCLPSCCQSKLAEGFLQSFGALGMRTAQLREPLREHLLRACTLFAKEAAHMHDEVDRTPTRWKIMQLPGVPALDPRRLGSTRRA